MGPCCATPGRRPGQPADRRSAPRFDLNSYLFSLFCAQPLHAPEGRGIAGVLAMRFAKLLQRFGIPALLLRSLPKAAIAVNEVDFARRKGAIVERNLVQKPVPLEAPRANMFVTQPQIIGRLRRNDANVG